MLKFLSLFLLLTSFLWAQKFSALANTTDTYLNFEATENDTLPIFVDEGSSLAWQNSPYLLEFQEKSLAQAYCKNLKLGDYSWVLPSSDELKNLPMYSNISFGHEKSYMANDKPVWDNTLMYLYDAKLKRKRSSLEDSQKLLVRCVARLEE